MSPRKTLHKENLHFKVLGWPLRQADSCSLKDSALLKNCSKSDLEWNFSTSSLERKGKSKEPTGST